ncbi:TonB-dependent receptor [Henriciella mobilis]|uniref:TonB-dependent receptor n=1 Tax=Henriciella mobilis TaxID=2305467 RepID=A0A399RRV0_9PROT|nr:TonB-dependent receptor [Henriciella mobilis]RIJ33053.1 TonB-dependent receptor [Henriciella mobilis]
MVLRVSLRHSLVTTTSLALLAGFGPAAVAQDNDTGAAAASEEAAAEAEVDSDRRLTSIQVTAQRKEESVLDVPMSIQAFGEDQLDDLRVNSVDDLQSVIPSFTVSQSYQGVPTYTLRGIGFNTINVSATSTVGTYVDEVAYPFPFMNSGPVFDVNRVEVLKGPQGTLFGRNTTAGLINVVTNKPGDEFEGSLGLDVGNYDTINYEGMINVPLADNVQARFAARHESSEEGWQVSDLTGQDRGTIDKTGFRAALAWQPTSNIDIDLSWNGWTNNSDTIGGQAIGLTPATNPLSPFAGGAAAFNAPGVVDYVLNNNPTDAETAEWAPTSARASTQFGISGFDGPLEEDSSFNAYKLGVDWRFDNGMQLSSLTGYNDLQREALLDWSGAPAAILLQDIDAEIESFSQEFRLEGSTGIADWMVGVYYSKDEITDSNQTLLRDNANSNFISTIATGLAYDTENTLRLLNPALVQLEQANPAAYAAAIAQQTAFINSLNVDPETGLPYSPAEILGSFQKYRDIGEFESTSASIFANANWRLTPEWELITGVRYTQDEQDYIGCSGDIDGSMQPNVNIFNRFFFVGFYPDVTAPPAPLLENSCNTYSNVKNSFGPVESNVDEDNLSWRVVANYTPTNMENLLLFGSVSKGYKSAATPVNAASKAEQNFPATQESLLAYELGMKAGLLDGRMQANASLFYYDYEDKQGAQFFPDPIYTALSQLQNAPEAKAYGLDAEVTWLLTDELTAIGGLTLLNTEYGSFDTFDFAGQPTNVEGDPFLYSPETAASLTLLYDKPISPTLGLQATLNGRWQSDSTAGDPDNPLYDIDSYGILNGSIGLYSLESGWEVSLWGRNLTDEYYWQQITSNANVIMRFAGKPRTYGASLTYRF